MRIRSFDQRCSSCQASVASFSLRLTVRPSIRVLVLHELLCDRRAALDDLLVADVVPERAGHAPHVDPAVLPEAPVLDRDDCLLHHRRDLLGADDDPALGAAQDCKDRFSVGGVDVPETLGPPFLSRLERGKLAGEGGDQTVRERDRRHEGQAGEQGEEPELAEPAPAPSARAPTSSEQHEAGSLAPAVRLPARWRRAARFPAAGRRPPARA